MNTYRKILSYLLLTLYVISGAHGAVTHCHDSSHEHVEHSHSHEHHDYDHDHDGARISFLHSLTHEILHVVAHFIEHSLNDHECCNIALLVEVDTVKTASATNGISAIIWKSTSKFPLKQNTCKTYYLTDHYKEIFLCLSSLRGPPSIL